jgi:hypothetical protein
LFFFIDFETHSLRWVIQNRIEDPRSEGTLAGKFNRGYKAEVEDSYLVFKVVEASPEALSPAVTEAA